MYSRAIFYSIILNATIFATPEINHHAFGLKFGNSAKFYPYYQYWSEHYGFHVGLFESFHLYQGRSDGLWNDQMWNFGFGVQKIISSRMESFVQKRSYLFIEQNNSLTQEHHIFDNDLSQSESSTTNIFQPSLNLGYGAQIIFSHWALAIEAGYMYAQKHKVSSSWLLDEYLFSPSCQTSISYAFKFRESVVGRAP